MEFIHLNTNWNADPNVPMPTIQIFGSNIKLSFFLNTFLFSQFCKSDLGILEFFNCRQYRIGPPNDEGFYLFNQSRYKKYGVKWGEFYLIKDSDWETNFPEPIYIDTKISLNNIKHYLYYFKDETFECISESYTFKVNRTSGIA